MGNLKLVCHACKYEIASISKDTKLPLIGAMFLSKDEKHGFPPPWSPVVTPVHMYCPMCQTRPFPMPKDDKVVVVTSEGERVITKDGIDINYQFADGVVNEEDVQPDVIDNDDQIPESGTDDTENDEEVVEDDKAPMSGFDMLLENGDIIQHGSWYEFEDKKYRKAELEKIVNG